MADNNTPTPVVTPATSGNTGTTAPAPQADSAQKAEVIENLATKPDAQLTPVERKLKLKIFGKEQELPESEVIRRAQLSTAAEKRLQEAHKQRSQAEEFYRLLKTDPRRVLTHPSIGVDLRKMAEEILAEELRAETLTPEQRELAQAKKELEDFRNKDLESKKQQEFRRQQALIAEAGDRMDEEFGSALQNSGLPKSPRTLQRMAYYKEQALVNKIDVSAADIVFLVREDYQREIEELFGSTDDNALLGLLGENVAGKIRKADLARLNTNPGAPSIGTPIPAGKKAQAEAEAKAREAELARLSLKERRARVQQELDDIATGKRKA